MCPGPVIAEYVAATDKSAVEHGVESMREQEAPIAHVLSAGLFPPEKASGLSDTTETEEEEESEEFVTDDDDTDEDQDNLQAGSLPLGFAPLHSPTTCYENGSVDGGLSEASGNGADAETQETIFAMEETLFVFDWDDTLLPSTWLQRQGLRLDDGSKPSQRHREQLAEVATSAIELIRNAKQCGKVVLVTNAERGWIELSCQKFLPSLLPLLENVKAVSARTSFESPSVTSPLEWKLRAFESEITTIYGRETLLCPESRKNVLSLGDSVHEREALLRATASIPNCRAKALKFVERPDISQICKQHSLVNGCFDRVTNHDGHLDLCIQCT